MKFASRLFSDVAPIVLHSINAHAQVGSVMDFGQARESSFGRILSLGRDLGRGGDSDSRIEIFEIDLVDAKWNRMVHISAKVAVAGRETAGIYGGAYTPALRRSLINRTSFSAIAFIVALLLGFARESVAVAPATKMTNDALRVEQSKCIQELKAEAVRLTGEDDPGNFIESFQGHHCFKPLVTAPVEIFTPYMLDAQADWRFRLILGTTLASKKTVAADRLIFDSVQKSSGTDFPSMMGVKLGREQFDLPSVAKVLETAVEDETLPLAFRVGIMASLGAEGFDDVDWLHALVSTKYPKDKVISIDEGTGLIWNAVRAMGHSRNKKATNILIRYQAQYPQNDIATEALMNRHDPAAIPVLIKVLQYVGPKVSLSRETAAQALGSLNAKDAVSALIKVIKNDADTLVVTRCTEALARIDDPRGHAAVHELANGLDTDKRFDSEREMAKHGSGEIVLIRKAAQRIGKKK